MLVLSRKAGQRVFIGDDIVVEVRRVAGNRVTLALEAPRDVRILRSELQQAATEFDMELPEEEAEDPSKSRCSADARPDRSAFCSHTMPRELVG